MTRSPYSSTPTATARPRTSRTPMTGSRRVRATRCGGDGRTFTTRTTRCSHRSRRSRSSRSRCSCRTSESSELTESREVLADPVDELTDRLRGGAGVGGDVVDVRGTDPMRAGLGLKTVDHAGGDLQPLQGLEGVHL